MNQFISKMRTVKGLNIHYALIQALYWVASASMYGYLVVFLTGRGFGTSDIGFLNSARTGVAIFAQLFFAYVGDKFKHKIPLKYIITVTVSLGFIANAAIQFSRPGFAGMLALFLILGATECSIVSLMDTLAIQFMNCGVPVNYSVCRSFGSGAYGVTCVLIGILTDIYSTEVIVMIHGGALLLYVIAVITFMTCHIPEKKNKKNARYETYKVRKKEGSIKALLMDYPQYRYVLLANIFVCFGFWPCNSFVATVMENCGGSNGMLGVYMFLTSVLEMPMMAIIFPRLIKKVAPEKLLAVSAAGHMIRWFLIGMVNNPYLLICLSVCQMFSYAISLPSAIYYINDNIAEDNKIKGQTFYNIAGNIGGTIGGAIFGVVMEQFGVRVMYLAGSAVIGLGFLCMLKMLVTPKTRISKQETAEQN